MSDRYGREERSRRRSRSRSRDRSRRDERTRRSRSRERDDRRGDRYAGDDRRRRDRDDWGNGGNSLAGPPAPSPRLDWLCLQCQAQNFARRVQCFKCSAAKTDACPVIRGGDLSMSGVGLGGGPGLDDLVAPQGQASPTVLVKHLSPDVTIEEIADAFRVYAQVKEVKLVFDPRPGASRNPAALVEFYAPEMAAHVVSSTSGSSGAELKIGRRASAKPQLAKPTAALLVDAWQHRAAQEHEQAQRLLEQQRMLLSYREKTSAGDAFGGCAGGVGGGYGGYERGDERVGARGPPLVAAKKVVPQWPPSFEEDGMSWVFDAASGYFLHRATEMYYEPKAKYYSKVVEGKYEYFHHAPGHIPPYVPMAAATPQQQQQQQQPEAASASTLAAVADAGGSKPQQQSDQQQHPPQALAPATPAVPTASAAAVAAAEIAAAKAAALSAAAAHEKEAKRQAKHALSVAKKKNQKDMEKWKTVQQQGSEDDAQTCAPVSIVSNSSASASVASALPQQQHQTSRSVPTIIPSVTSGLFGSGDNGVGVAPLLALGTDYASIGKLRLLPEGTGAGERATGQPLTEGGGNKWACLVSRRAFPSEEQLAKHVRVSKLYREELAKAISQGRVVLLS